MKTRNAAIAFGLILLGTALVAGFVAVLEKRFAEGGVYPHYASYRSDPLGTSAFFESLGGFESLAVSRNITNLNLLKNLDGDTVLLLLGYPRDGFEDLRAPEASPVMQAVEAGARLVVTLNPELVPELYRPERSELEDDWIERRRRIREERARREAEARKDGEKDGENGAAKDESEDEEDEEERNLEQEMEETLGPRLTRKLGFEIASPNFGTRPEEGWETRAGETVSAPAMPAELPIWRSQYRLEARDPAWRAALSVGDDPVVLERRWGRGSVVVATDTYFASNESLHLEASPAFLLWLLGGKAKVVFDETIHGTVESGGAMKLIRRHRAHGIFFGLVLFFALWAWRSTSPLVPGSEALDRGLLDGAGTVLGEGGGTGLIRLLRRSVPPSALLAQCVETWRASATAEIPAKTGEDIAALVRRHRSDPRHFGAAEAYRAIAERLRKR